MSDMPAAGPVQDAAQPPVVSITSWRPTRLEALASLGLGLYMAWVGCTFFGYSPVSGEATKSGFTPAEALECADRVASLPGVSVEGLMTMAPASDPDAARRAFSGLRDLRDALKEATGLPLRELSCGMSGDFGIAIEEGSTLIRLGRVVFDQSFDIEL